MYRLVHGPGRQTAQTLLIAVAALLSLCGVTGAQQQIASGAKARAGSDVAGAKTTAPQPEQPQNTW